MNAALVRVAVDFIAAPFAALAHDPEERSDFYERDAEIIVTARDARQIERLPAGEDVSLRVIDQLSDRVLILVREDEDVVLAAVDPDYTARHREAWAMRA